jgi:hypothetical protein
MSNCVALRADQLVVGRWLGAEALGIYGRAYCFVGMPANLFGTVVDRVIFPAMAVVQDRQKLAEAYSRAVGLVALTTIPLSAVLFALAPEIVRILLGPHWDSVVTPFRILVTVLIFRTSYKMSDSLARATGAVYRRAWRQWLYAGAVFLGAWLGQFWGTAGVAGVAALCNLPDASLKPACVSWLPWLSFTRLCLYVVLGRLLDLRPPCATAVFTGARLSAGLATMAALLLSCRAQCFMTKAVGLALVKRSGRRRPSPRMESGPSEGRRARMTQDIHDCPEASVAWRQAAQLSEISSTAGTSHPPLPLKASTEPLAGSRSRHAFEEEKTLVEVLGRQDLPFSASGSTIIPA